jgi:hypothetical protein
VPSDTHFGKSVGYVALGEGEAEKLPTRVRIVRKQPRIKTPGCGCKRASLSSGKRDRPSCRWLVIWWLSGAAVGRCTHVIASDMLGANESLQA